MNQPRRGFTLIEAITTMTIVTVIGVISSPIIMAAAESYAAATTRAELASACSTALERIVTELREIPARPGVSPARPHIDEVTPGSITWEGVKSLRLAGSTLLLTVDGANGRVLLEDVESFSVRAFDGENNAMGTVLSGRACDGVRRVQVVVTVSRSGVSETLRTAVFVRSMISGA
ncbi:MAG: type II secretion system protein [Phycisphaerales bacterium]